MTCLKAFLTINRRALILGAAAASVQPTTAWATAIEEAAPQWIAVRDVDGRRVQVPRPVNRLVTLMYTDFHTAALLGVRPVATRDRASHIAFIQREILGDTLDVPPIASVLNADWTADLERIALERPDLIIVRTDDEVSQLRAVAPTFKSFRWGSITSVEHVLDYTRLMAEALGRVPAGEGVIARFVRRLEAYSRLSPKTKTVIMAFGLGRGQRHIYGRKTLYYALISRFARYCPDLPETRLGNYIGNSELLSTLHFDHLIHVVAGQDLASERDAVIRADRLWASHPAVRSGQVSTVGWGLDGAANMDLWGLTRFLDRVVPALYPKIFPAPLTESQIAAVLDG